jgi:hypothetical protein
MIPNMKYRLLSVFIVAATLLAPIVAFAAKEDEDTAKLDGRLEGYASGVRLASGSTALTWLLIGLLSAIAVATLFKNAKRTHLD